jgi:hypothetical protein
MESANIPGKDIYDIVASDNNSELKLQKIAKLLESKSSPNYLDDNGHSSLSLSIYLCRVTDNCQGLPIVLMDSGAELINTKPLLSYSVQANLNWVVRKLIEKNYIPSKEDLIDLSTILKKPGLVDEDIKSLVTSYLKNIKLKKLREKKGLDPERLTGVNHPSTAFVMLGHGGEDTTRQFRVPKGCILVVQVHSGETNYLPNDFFQNIFEDPEKEKFLDPVTNYKYIVDKINSTRDYFTPLAIYREGDIYPGMFYTLLLQWDRGSSLQLDYSGVAQYPFTKGPPGLGDKRVKKNTPGKDVFLSLYDKSIYPTRSKLEELVDNLPPELPKTIENIVNSANIDKNINIFQADLFEKLGPGVYYNLVCRSSKHLIQTIDPETDRKIINNSKRALVDSSGIIIKDRVEIQRDLIESLAQRGPLIEKLNKNNPDHNPLVQPVKHDIKLPYQEIEKLDKELHDKYLTLHFSKNLNLAKSNELRESINTIVTLYSDKLMEYYNNKINEYEQIYQTDEGKTKQDKYGNNIMLILNNYKYKKRRLEELIHENIVVNAKFNRRPYLNESVLKEKQRLAHNKLIQDDVTKGLSVQLAENNSKGFEERRVLAERQAQEYLNKRVSKNASGGRRTRTRRVKRKTRKTRR